MTAVTPSGEALAKVLSQHLHAVHLGVAWDYDPSDLTPCAYCHGMSRKTADRLIASGAVVPLDTLADDEALVEAVAENVRQDEVTRAEKRVAVQWLRAIAAALSERGDR
jgi:hypothetical protein